MSKENSPANSEQRIADLNQMTVAELKDLAGEMQIDSTSGLRKSELVEKIAEVQDKLRRTQAAKSTDWLEVNEAGPYWLAVKWHVSEKLLKRAIASLGTEWHSAKKVIRLYRVDWDDSGPHAREHIKDFLVPADSKNWFVNTGEKSSGWKLELGFLVPGGKFFSLLHSADIRVDTSQKHEFSNSPQPQLNLNSVFSKKEDLRLSIEGDIALKGATTAGAKVSIDDDQVKVNDKTGLFTWKTPLQNGRLVIPVQAEIGNQRQRVIISVEANVHYLEPEKTGIDS